MANLGVKTALHIGVLVPKPNENAYIRVKILFCAVLQQSKHCGT